MCTVRDASIRRSDYGSDSYVGILSRLIPLRPERKEASLRKEALIKRERDATTPPYVAAAAAAAAAIGSDNAARCYASRC